MFGKILVLSFILAMSAPSPFAAAAQTTGPGVTGPNVKQIAKCVINAPQSPNDNGVKVEVYLTDNAGTAKLDVLMGNETALYPTEVNKFTFNNNGTLEVVVDKFINLLIVKGNQTVGKVIVTGAPSSALVCDAQW